MSDMSDMSDDDGNICKRRASDPVVTTHCIRSTHTVGASGAFPETAGGSRGTLTHMQTPVRDTHSAADGIESWGFGVYFSTAPKTAKRETGP